jgi:ribosomal protein L29
MKIKFTHLNLDIRVKKQEEFNKKVAELKAKGLSCREVFLLSVKEILKD